MQPQLKAWLQTAVLLSIVAGLVFVTAHQVMRQSANDPQIQLAEDWADSIATDGNVTGLSMGPFVDPDVSLASFGIVYGASGNIASSSVTAPTTMLLPDGVLGAVDRATKQQVRFTWAPSSGSRFAAVIQRTSFGDKTYYVLAGRNLREVENRTAQIAAITLAAWVVGLAVMYAALHTHVARRVVHRLRKKKS